MSRGAFAVTYINHALAQFAGEVGLVSLGLGKDFTRYSISGLFGIVPPDVSGVQTIETITLRQTYDITHWKRLTFYGGLNVFHVLGLQYQSTTFRDTPEGYYALGSLRALLNLGIGIEVREKSIIYFEAGLNDIWITNWITNRDVVNPSDHVSLALGFKQYF